MMALEVTANLPRDASCKNCSKGFNGANTCPITGIPVCAAYQSMVTPAGNTIPASRPNTTVPPILQTVPQELVPGLVREDVAKLAEAILRIWRKQTGDGNFNKYSIVNFRNPALAPAYDRFKARAAALLDGRTMIDDMSYVLWSLMMLGGGARKEYVGYCERVELQLKIDSQKEGQVNDSRAY